MDRTVVIGIIIIIIIIILQSSSYVAVGIATATATGTGTATSSSSVVGVVSKNSILSVCHQTLVVHRIARGSHLTSVSTIHRIQQLLILVGSGAVGDVRTTVGCFGGEGKQGVSQMISFSKKFIDGIPSKIQSIVLYEYDFVEDAAAAAAAEE